MILGIGVLVRSVPKLSNPDVTDENCTMLSYQPIDAVLNLKDAYLSSGNYT